MPKDTLYKTEIITVYKDSIQKGELVELYQSVLENQSNNFTLLISTLIGITVALLGATALWNYYYSKKQIKQEVEEGIEEKYHKLKKDIENLINTQYENLETLINDKLETEKNRMNTLLSNSEQAYDKKFKELEQDNIRERRIAKAEVTRLMAAFNESQKEYYFSVMWWIEAIELYNRLEDDRMLRVSVSKILQIMQNKGWSVGATVENIDIGIGKITAYMPTILSEEKNKILAELNTLKR